MRAGTMRVAELTEAAIWLQTSSPADVRLRFWPAGRAAEARLSAPARSTEASHGTAILVMTGLAPGTRYEYEILLGGGPALRNPDWTFATQAFTPAAAVFLALDPPLRERTSAVIRENYGAPEIFGGSRGNGRKRCRLGDNVYYREPDFGSATGLRERNALARQDRRLARLLATASHYAIWDDHDFGPNNAVWTYRLAPAAQEAFELFWANPGYGTPGIRGIFGQFSWADVDFFLLDGRTYRTPETAADAASRRMLGPEQMRWLQDALLSSEAPFKIVAFGSQVLNRLAAVDTLRLYPSEYRQLVDFLVANRVRGVVFVSGDKHHAELITRPCPLLTPCTLTSSRGRAALLTWEEENPQRGPDARLDKRTSSPEVLRPCKDRRDEDTWDEDGPALEPDDPARSIPAARDSPAPGGTRLPLS